MKPSWKRCSSLKVSAKAWRRLSEGRARSRLCWNWENIPWGAEENNVFACGRWDIWIINSICSQDIGWLSVSNNENAVVYSVCYRLLVTFNAQKMHDSPRQKCPGSCLKLRLKMSSCHSTYRRERKRSYTRQCSILWSFCYTCHPGMKTKSSRSFRWGGDKTNSCLCKETKPEGDDHLQPARRCLVLWVTLSKWHDSNNEVTHQPVPR